MNQNEPKRQHLVPRCYLKHFALARKKEWFLDAYDKTSHNPKIFNVNTKGICVETDFYTFKKLKEKDKRFMERYYSRTVEADYTEVYEALINRKSVKLSPNLRFKIISFVTCQYFRTSKITHAFNNLWNRSLEHSSMLMENRLDKKVYLQGGGTIDFAGRTVEEIKDEESNKNREVINIKNYELFRKWTIEKLDYIITVNQAQPSFGYIIGDNPVIPHGHIFDPKASISMPLNSQYCLTLIPFDNGIESDLSKIHHLPMGLAHSKLHTIFNNISQYERAQRFVMGKSTLISKTLDDMLNFDVDAFNKESAEVIKKMNSGIVDDDIN